MRIAHHIAGLGLALALTGPVTAQDGTTSLTAELALRHPITGAPMQPSAGQMVRLDLVLTDAVTGQHPRDVPLQGWVRPDLTTNSSCEQATRGFLTTGAVPTGAVNLNTSALAMVSRDGSVGVIDPKLNLMSANMLSAFSLDEPPAGLVVDTAAMRLLVTQVAQGRVLGLPVTGGEPDLLASGLVAPEGISMTHNGDIWVASARDGGLTRLGSDGTLHETIPLSGQKVVLRDEVD